MTENNTTFTRVQITYSVFVVKKTFENEHETVYSVIDKNWFILTWQKQVWHSLFSFVLKYKNYFHKKYDEHPIQYGNNWTGMKPSINTTTNLKGGNKNLQLLKFFHFDVTEGTK